MIKINKQTNESKNFLKYCKLSFSHISLILISHFVHFNRQMLSSSFSSSCSSSFLKRKRNLDNISNNIIALDSNFMNHNIKSLSSEIKTLQNQKKLKGTLKSKSNRIIFTASTPIQIIPHPSELIPTLYGLESEERDQKTRGHQCIKIEDRILATKSQSSLLYGEVLFEGAAKLFDSQHLNAEKGTVLVDLGSGVGKLALQAFLQFPNLSKVVGVELSPSRVTEAHSALQKLATSYSTSFQFNSNQDVKEDHDTSINSSSSLSVPQIGYRCTLSTQKKKSQRKYRGKNHIRKLDIICNSLFSMEDIVAESDIVICETQILPESYSSLVILLSKMKSGARLLTYEDLNTIYDSNQSSFPFTQLEINKNNLEDRFKTTWATNKGHHFYLWTKI